MIIGVLTRHYAVYDFVSHSVCVTVLYCCPPENPGGRQQLWPRFYSGRAHAHAHRWPYDPFHQPGGIQKLFLYFTWTAGELRLRDWSTSSRACGHPYSSQCLCICLKHFPLAYKTRCGHISQRYNCAKVPSGQPKHAWQGPELHLNCKNLYLRPKCGVWPAFEITFSFGFIYTFMQVCMYVWTGCILLCCILMKLLLFAQFLLFCCSEMGGKKLGSKSAGDSQKSQSYTNPGMISCTDGIVSEWCISTLEKTQIHTETAESIHC